MEFNIKGNDTTCLAPLRNKTILTVKDMSAVFSNSP